MPYCTITDLQHVLSSTGVSLRVDDGVAAEEVAECIEEADQEIEQATHYLYTAASITASVWIQHRAKNIAAYLLCCRRGNPGPASLEARYTRAIEQLEKVRLGQLLIPGAVMSKAAAPTMSNMAPSLRPHPRSVVETKKSTGKAEGYNQNNRDPWDKLVTENLDFAI